MGPVLADTATMGGNGGSIVPAPRLRASPRRRHPGDLGREARFLGADAVGRPGPTDRIVFSTATKREEAQGLVELIVALTVLAIGIGSLLTLLTSSALSLQRSDQKGTALVLAEKQIELYRGVAYKDIRLDQNSSTRCNASIRPATTVGELLRPARFPSASGQLTDTAPGNVTHGLPGRRCPARMHAGSDRVTGPDQRQYRIDTYIHADNPNGGDAVAHRLRRRAQRRASVDRSSRAAPRRSRRSTSRT